jgi:hypothetical protein
MTPTPFDDLIQGEKYSITVVTDDKDFMTMRGRFCELVIEAGVMYVVIVRKSKKVAIPVKMVVKIEEADSGESSGDPKV